MGECWGTHTMTTLSNDFIKTATSEFLPPLNKLIEKPPKTHGFPLVGSIPHVLRKQIRFLEDAREQYGDVYDLNLGLTNMIMLNRPEHAQHVLRDHARNYTKGGPMWAMIRTLLGNGLPVSEGEFWMRQRRMMQPQFHRRRLEVLTQYMADAIDDGLAELDELVKAGGPINMAQEFANITMKVIVRAMFGTGLAREAVTAVSDNLAFALDFMLTGLITDAFPSWMPVPGRARYQQSIEVIDEIVFAVIEQRRNEGLGDDMISMLLDMVDDETGAQMTDQQLRDEAVSLFLAGYETTSVAMSWSLHFLTQAPMLMEKLQGAVDDTVGQRQITFTDLHALEYPRWVMQEALRLYSPVFWLWRTAEENDVIDGFLIEKGQNVALAIHNIHRHPDVWDDPTTFDPERFSAERSEGRHSLAWMAFGAGQRQCIGRDFALMEGQLILSKLIQRYTIEAIPGRVAEPHIALTLRTKDGVWVNLKRR